MHRDDRRGLGSQAVVCQALIWSKALESDEHDLASGLFTQLLHGTLGKVYNFSFFHVNFKAGVRVR